MHVSAMRVRPLLCPFDRVVMSVGFPNALALIRSLDINENKLIIVIRVTF